MEYSTYRSRTRTLLRSLKILFEILRLTSTGPQRLLVKLQTLRTFGWVMLGLLLQCIKILTKIYTAWCVVTKSWCFNLLQIFPGFLTETLDLLFIKKIPKLGSLIRRKLIPVWCLGSPLTPLVLILKLILNMRIPRSSL